MKVISAEFSNNALTYDNLGRFVRSAKNKIPNYHDDLPDIKSKDKYSRRILCMEPLECVLLRWPPEVESAVHFHDGFWGYVWVLDGICENVEYKIKDGKMFITSQLYARKGGVIDEPDGTIHLIRNPSKDKELITCHFYYPALETLDGLKVYDLESGKIGTLNDKAATASFLEPDDHFRDLEEGAFVYQTMLEAMPTQTHRMCPVLPKPSSEEIKSMIGAYYAEQASQYDLFDLSHHSRKQYVQKINQLIAEKVKGLEQIDKALAIACGTGRRAAKIRELSERAYDITCVDISEEMCCQATERNVRSIAGDWLRVNVGDDIFDVTTFLYAFGHIPFEEERIAALKKIHKHMSDGGLLFIDVFNQEDQNEWGPKAVRRFESDHLEGFGYDKGDLFYRKADGHALSFLHYFTREEMVSLLEKTGFEVIDVYNIGYVKRSGEVLDGKDERGSLFFVARKVRQ